MAANEAYNRAVDAAVNPGTTPPTASTGHARRRLPPHSLTEQARRKAWAERNAAEWKRLKQEGRWA